MLEKRRDPDAGNLETERAIMHLLREYGLLEKTAVVSALKEKFPQNAVEITIERLVSRKMIVAVQGKIALRGWQAAG